MRSFIGTLSINLTCLILRIWNPNGKGGILLALKKYPKNC